MKKKENEIKIKKENEEIEETIIEEKSASFNLLEVIVIILMTSLIVGVSTGIIVYKNYSNIEASKSEKAKDNITVFKDAYNKILNGYVEKIDEDELLNAAIIGMYNYLGDPYTGYLDQVTTDDLTDRLEGEYEGIGIEISKTENGILVANVFENGPAYKAGIEVGDILTKIDGKELKKVSAQEASNMIKSSKKDEIEISFFRGGITKTVTVNIKKVYIPSVTKEKYENVGYLRIDTFSATTYNQFKKSLLELEEDGITSLIIDVRNNGGGYLNSAVEIAELFIEKGKTIYGLEKKNGTVYYEDTTSTKRDYKISVLINGSSASASEVLAAALKESYDATLVGTLSYGKGTVQETKELSSGGMIKYTTAYWLTPKGNKINEIGITPDIKVNASYKLGMTLEEDIQLQEAIKSLK